MLGAVCSRFNWVVHGYCQMSNHYHLLLETVDGNLARSMRQLNGRYTQRFNRRHGLVGHLFQGRYKAILVQKENYLLELTRYVVLNPLRARMVESLDDWPWSSHLAVTAQDEPLPWLDTGMAARPVRQQPRRSAQGVLAIRTGRPGPAQPAGKNLPPTDAWR